MDNASKNAGDMINRLTLQYNRGRQAAITNELVDIITGENICTTLSAPVLIPSSRCECALSVTVLNPTGSVDVEYLHTGLLLLPTYRIIQ